MQDTIDQARHAAAARTLADLIENRRAVWPLCRPSSRVCSFFTRPSLRRDSDPNHRRTTPIAASIGE